MSKNTGGPAFPLHNHGAQTLGMHLSGMTLRDWLAGMAMQGWLSTYPTDHGLDEVYEDGISEFAYRIADSMLKAREQ